MRYASRLLDAHTHLVIITRLHQFQFHWFNRQIALARRQWNDHEVFESLPPMSTAPRLHNVILMLNVKQGSCEYQFLKFFGIAWQGSEPRLIDCKADALTAAPSLLPLHHHCSIKRRRTRKRQCTNSGADLCWALRGIICNFTPIFPIFNIGGWNTTTTVSRKQINWRPNRKNFLPKFEELLFLKTSEGQKKSKHHPALRCKP